MARAPRPPLYRAARYFSLAATVVMLVIILYVGATVYSATKIRPGDTGNGGNNGNNHGGNNGNGSGNNGGTQFSEVLTAAGLQISVALNFSNPGFLPIQGVRLSAVVDGPGNGSRLATGSSPDVEIPAGSVGVIPLTIVIPLGGSSPVLPLLTKNAQLPTEVYANVTLSSLFAVDVGVATNISWGAPFGGLTLVPGTPSSSNGSTTIPFTVSFSNNASFADTGQVSLVVHGSNGCTATLPSLPLNVAAHSGYQSVQTVTVPSSCALATWSTVSGSYTSSTWSSPLPTENLA
ncbi:MAG TPA: hypothetical protein VMH90_05095 [Thermoplasmata archaeon]|nr:hypothetical protein [Thermoplasmata archaeon]